MASFVIVNNPPAEEAAPVDETPDQELSFKGKILKRAGSSHGKIPGIRRIPLPAIGIILLVAVVNLAVWVVVAIVLVRETLATIMDEACADSFFAV